MKLFFLYLLLTSCALTSTAEPARGVVPGVTTRAAFAQLTGMCGDPQKLCQFMENGQRIRVIFSKGVMSNLYPCANSLLEDTVLLVEMTPTKPTLLKELRLGKNLKPLGRPARGFRAYIDENAGLVVLSRDRKAIHVVYMASHKARNRCLDYYKKPELFVQVMTHCPPVSLHCPLRDIEAGEKIILRADIPEDPKLTLSWKLSGGNIIGPANRQTLTVDTSGLNVDTLQVTLEGRGSCDVESSCTISIKRSEK